MRALLPAAGLILLLALFAPAAPPPPQEIVLGAPTSLTTLEGSESLKAVRLAVAEINRAGGVRLGRRRLKIRVESCDLADALPGTTPAQALLRLRTFLQDKKPQALVIGPFRSEVLLEAMDLLARFRMPTLGVIAMSPAVSAKVLKDRRYRYIFRVGLSTRYLVEYLVAGMKLVARRFGFSRVFIMNQDVAWARSTASLMLKLYFTRAGWQVLGQRNYPPGTRDFRPDLQRARDRGAQVILTIFDMPSSGELVEQWYDMRVPALISGFISPMSGPRAWPASQGRIAGALSVVFELGNIPSRRYRPARRFYRAYRQRYGGPIQSGHGPAPAYEAVYILAQAIQRAGSLDPEALVRALEKTDRQGVMGRIRFHRGHQVIFGRDPRKEALACVVQWTDQGRRKIVFPRAIAEGQITLPAFVEER